LYDGLIQLKTNLAQALREPRQDGNLPRIALATAINVFVR